jgi:hypothetical protein
VLIGNIVPEVWVPPMQVRELRALISFRWRIGKQIAMSKNRLHSVVQRFNLDPPEGNLLADKNQPWWDQQEFTELTGFQVELDLEIITHLEAQKARIDQKLAELSDTAPWADDMVYLMQIPGFGLLTSMILLAAIGDISRFSHPKKLVGYAGLGAGVHDSGKKHQDSYIALASPTKTKNLQKECGHLSVGDSCRGELMFRIHDNQKLYTLFNAYYGMVQICVDTFFIWSNFLAGSCVISKARIRSYRFLPIPDYWNRNFPRN